MIDLLMEFIAFSYLMAGGGIAVAVAIEVIHDVVNGG